MIIETILNVLKTLIISIIDILPNIDYLQIPSSFLDWLADIIGGCAYFLPISDFLIMFGFWILITNYQIIWRIAQRIWDALPFT